MPISAPGMLGRAAGHLRMGRGGEESGGVAISSLILSQDRLGGFGSHLRIEVGRGALWDTEGPTHSSSALYCPAPLSNPSCNAL